MKDESAGVARKDVLAVGKQDEYIYTSLFDSRKNKLIASPHESVGSGEDEDRDAEEGLAELVVTLDPITTGFLTDLQLFINICIDKGSYKLKVGVQSACDFLGTSVTKMSLRDLLHRSQDTSPNENATNFSNRATFLVTDALKQSYKRLKRGIKWPFSLMK